MSGLAGRYGLGADAPGRLARLLEALAAESDPPTAVRDPLEAIDTHVADSLCGLSVERLRRAARVADVGAGAGFPGLPLAIALPGARVDLIEAARRKCDVIERLAAAAAASNARAVHARAEEWGAGEGREIYDAVTARALAPLAVLAEYAAPLLREGGVLIAWKGARDREEERAGRTAATEIGLEPAEVRRVRPFQGARNRHLHVFAKIASTPDRYPRRAGMATKRPLA